MKNRGLGCLVIVLTVGLVNIGSGTLSGSTAALDDPPIWSWHRPSNPEPPNYTMRHPVIVTDDWTESIMLFVGISPIYAARYCTLWYRIQGQSTYTSLPMYSFCEIWDAFTEYFAAVLPPEFPQGTCIEYYFELDSDLPPGVYCVTYVYGGTTSTFSCNEGLARLYPFAFCVYRQAPPEITGIAQWEGLLYVPQTVWIRPAAALTILPGAEVHFAAGTSLMIQGGLTAAGMGGCMIKFRSVLSNPNPASWGSITFLDSSSDAVWRTDGQYREGCLMEYCEVEHGGPGIVCEQASPLITHSHIHDCRANVGSGIRCTESFAVIRSSVLTGNLGSAVWAVSSSVTLRNCLIFGNQQFEGVSGVAGGDFSIVNCTIADNQGSGVEVTGTVNIVNCILWDNGLDIAPGYPLGSVRYCDIGSGAYQGSFGNISCPPQFLDPPAGDYHLAPDSCCINSGTCTGAPTEDYDGEARPDAETELCDIGFDEYHVPGTSTPTSTATPLYSTTPVPSATPVFSASPTPSPFSETTISLLMPAHIFQPGDHYWLLAFVGQEGRDLVEAALVIVLDINSDVYFFWPSWNPYPPAMDFATIELGVGDHCYLILDRSWWPTGCGAGTGFHFYAAILDEDLTTLISNIGEWEFSYGE